MAGFHRADYGPVGRKARYGHDLPLLWTEASDR
jgi:hypothetical protein